MLEKIKCPERDSNPRHPDLMKGATEQPRQPQRSESNISYKGTCAFVSTINRSNSQSERPGSKCLVINVPLKLIFDSLRCGCLGSSVVRAPFMRSGCPGFESRSGHLIFSSICSVYIDRHIRVDLSDDERQELFRKPYNNRPYSYSRQWTGTSLQVRLMQEVFSLIAVIPSHEPPFQASSTPIPRK